MVGFEELYMLFDYSFSLFRIQAFHVIFDSISELLPRK